MFSAFIKLDESVPHACLSEDMGIICESADLAGSPVSAAQNSSRNVRKRIYTCQNRDA